MASRSADPPIPLTPTALARWRILFKLQAWSSSQLGDLAAYCAAYGRWADAEAWLAEPDHGPVLTIRDDKGNIRSHGPSPQIGISERSQKEMARLSAALRLGRLP